MLREERLRRPYGVGACCRAANMASKSRGRDELIQWKAWRDASRSPRLVVSLNMAGSVPDASDLVVSDPVRAGVMTVMAIADTAKFSVYA